MPEYKMNQIEVANCIRNSQVLVNIILYTIIHTLEDQPYLRLKESAVDWCDLVNTVPAPDVSYRMAVFGFIAMVLDEKDSWLQLLEASEVVCFKPLAFRQLQSDLCMVRTNFLPDRLHDLREIRCKLTREPGRRFCV